MPCWEVRTMSVEFKAKHRRLLEQAVEALGWSWKSEGQGLRVQLPGWNSFTIDFVEQKAIGKESLQGKINQLKQQYSKQALRRAAKLQGWQMKTKGQMKGVLRR